MTPPVWIDGPLAPGPVAAAPAMAWQVRLDDPAVEAAAGQAPLTAADLRDLAGRPDGAMRGLRRRLTRLLVARVTGVHPAAIALRRDPLGALHLDAPDTGSALHGWHVSVAGRWPHCLIGLARQPVGVDLEPLDADPPPADALTAAEARRLAGAAPHAWLACWVTKEAHAKCLGIASRIEPTAIETGAAAPGAVVTTASATGTTRGWVTSGMGTLRALALPA